LEATGGHRGSFLAKNFSERSFLKLHTRLKQIDVDADCNRKEVGLRISPGVPKKQTLCISEGKERVEGGVGTRRICVGPVRNKRRFCEIKPWKPRRKCSKMVLGRDVGMQEVSTLSLCALVGRFRYRALSKFDIDWWMEENWKPLSGYSPEVLVLVRGWFCF
jgi:hypothetical protein